MFLALLYAGDIYYNCLLQVGQHANPSQNITSNADLTEQMGQNTDHSQSLTLDLDGDCDVSRTCYLQHSILM